MLVVVGAGGASVVISAGGGGGAAELVDVARVVGCSLGVWKNWPGTPVLIVVAADSTSGVFSGRTVSVVVSST